MNPRSVLDLLQGGKAAATIIVPSDGSLDQAAQRLVQAVQAQLGVELAVIPATRPLTHIDTPHAIALGCLADNPFIEALYFRWHTLVDRWYPGVDGWVIQTIFSPLRSGEHVLLLGGSDTASVEASIDHFIVQLKTCSGGQIPWTFAVQLGAAHLPLPEDRIDVLGTAPSQVVIPENALPDQPYQSGFTGGSARNHLLRLGMYGPHADNFHLARSAEFGLRYLYTGSSEDAARYRQTLLAEVRAGVVQELYHYKSLRMLQLWSLFESNSVFSDEEREEITHAIRSYLLEESGIANIDDLRGASTGMDIFNRHTACDALNLWVGADWLWRLTGKSSWLDQRAVADTYFEAQIGVDVPLTGLTEGYASYLEVFLEWLLLSRPEKIVDDPHIRLWTDRVMGLCTNTGNLVVGPQTDEARYPYNLLRKLAYLLGDGRCQFVADLRERQVLQGMDRVIQFSAGQAYAGDIPVSMPDANRLTVYPMNERLRQWQAPSVPQDKGFDRIVARGGWNVDDDYLMLIGVRGAAKALPTVGSLAAYERFGQRLITSDSVPLFPVSASPWRHSTVCINVGGLGFGMPAGAVQLGQSEQAGGHVFSIQMTTPGLCRWIRTIYWQPSAYVLVIDRIVVEPDEDFSLGVNWRCGGEIKSITDGLATLAHESDVNFFIQVSAGMKLLPETNSYPVLGSPAGTSPTKETMLHATLDGGRETRGVSVATLLHAVKGKTNPQFRLITDSESWVVAGPDDSLRFGAGSEAGSLEIDAVNAPNLPTRSDDPLQTETVKISGELSTQWSVALPADVSSWTQSEEGDSLAMGMANGDIAMLDGAGQTRWRTSCGSSVNALKFCDGDLIAGTHSGQVYRYTGAGKLRWRYACQFRNEREIWPWWFMPTPAIGAIAASHDLVVAGTGGTSLNFLDGKTGELMADELSRYGSPDRIKSHLSTHTGELRFLVGHSRLTCGSTVRAWNQKAQIEISYEKSIEPMGRSMDGWDSCGVVDFWVGTLVSSITDRVVVLRHGAVNQLTVYEESTGAPLWDATLGDAPIALAVVPGDSANEARCHVAGQFGTLVTFDGNGDRVTAKRISSSLVGMQAGPDGSLALWNEAELHIIREGSPAKCFALNSTPMGLAGPTDNPGLLCIEQNNLCLKQIPW